MRAHVPWRLRAFIVSASLVLLLVLALWAFDFGQQIAGFNRGEINALQTANSSLEEEVSRLRARLAASENDLQIERAAQKLLTERHDALSEENAHLKEELAVMVRLSKTRKK